MTEKLSKGVQMSRQLAEGRMGGVYLLDKPATVLRAEEEQLGRCVVRLKEEADALMNCRMASLASVINDMRTAAIAVESALTAIGSARKNLMEKGYEGTNIGGSSY